MLHLLIPGMEYAHLAFFGIVFSFLATVIATAKLARFLPKDGGREFAHDGKLSAGKPRGAGIIFVVAFVVSVFLFVPLDSEVVIYMILLLICMMTGFLDDASKTPWGEYKKGFLDLCVAALTALTFLKYNSSVVELSFFHVRFVLHPVVFAILAVILVWTSVNVTNCADGVDGFHLEGFVNLVAQIAHIHIHHIGVPDIVIAPYIAEQRIAGHGLTLVGHQVTKQIELLLGQADGRTVP